MSWLSKNVGSLGNLASRIANEANGDSHQGTSEALQQLNQQLQETREELHHKQQEWERNEANYEARLKSLSEGNATAQKVEQLEHKLNRAVGLLKTLNGDKQNLLAKVKSLEEAQENAVVTIASLQQQHQQEEQDEGASDSVQRKELEDTKAQVAALVQASAKEKEEHVLLIEGLRKQLSEAAERNMELLAAIDNMRQHSQESDGHAEVSIQLELTKEDLEQATQEIVLLKEANAQLSANSSAKALVASNSSLPKMEKALAEAKATIADLTTRLQSQSNGHQEAEKLLSGHKVLNDRIASLTDSLDQANARHVEDQVKITASKSNQGTLEAEVSALRETVQSLESELKSAKSLESRESTGADSHRILNEELQERINALDQELKNSRESLSDLHIEAVSKAIASLLDSSRRDSLPKILLHDQIVATWNRAKDEVDSYKDGNRSLEDNLSVQRKANLEAQSEFQRKIDLFEASKASELEEMRKHHAEELAQLHDRAHSEANSQQELGSQLEALRLAQAESTKKLNESHEEKMRDLLDSNDALKKEVQTLTLQLEEDRREAESNRKEREQTILELEKALATEEQILKSIKDDLQKTTSERDHFQSQHKALLGRVSNMKSTLGTKLQADMDNINTMKQQIEHLTSQNADYLETIKQLEEELMASHGHYEKTSRELEHLRRRLVDIQEDASAEVVEKESMIRELESRLQREEREREDWETMASEQRASKDQAVVNMRSMERERDAAVAERESLRQELDSVIESLNNLQAVLEEFQSAKESEIQFALEGLYKQLNTANASLEIYRERAATAEEQLHHLTLDVEKARQLEREVKEKGVMIGKLRHDAVIQQGHLTEAMRRLKEENSQNSVDIPLISNLFISFLNIPRGDQKRFEILQLISGVLKFTDEQREQAGLIRRANNGLGAMTPTTSGSRSPSMEQMRQHEPKESFIDMWASFLIRESNANAAGNNGNTRSP